MDPVSSTSLPSSGGEPRPSPGPGSPPAPTYVDITFDFGSFEVMVTSFKDGTYRAACRFPEQSSWGVPVWGRVYK